MKNRILGFTFFLFVVITSLSADEYQLEQLKNIADGLNIEGGTIFNEYLRKDQIWSNLCVVLDRPFEDGIEWQELTDSNTFPLKEAVILDYNEAQVNYAYATVMYYYITHAHQILDKSTNKTAKILIQVHRNTSGPSHVDLLEQLLCQCYPELKKVKIIKNASLKSKYELFSYFFSDINVYVDFCYGVLPENLSNEYREADIILSFSLVAGFNPDWKSGSLLIPKQHIPFSLKNVCIALEKKYFVQNHLSNILSDLINNQDDKILQIINNYFISLNPKKLNSKAKKFIEDDFKNAILLQVDGMFNPSKLPKKFKLENTCPITLGDILHLEQNK